MFLCVPLEFYERKEKNRGQLENQLVTMKIKALRGMGKFRILLATSLITQNFLNILERFLMPDYLVKKGHSLPY